MQKVITEGKVPNKIAFSEIFPFILNILLMNIFGIIGGLLSCIINFKYSRGAPFYVFMGIKTLALMTAFIFNSFITSII